VKSSVVQQVGDRRRADCEEREDGPGRRPDVRPVGRRDRRDRRQSQRHGPDAGGVGRGAQRLDAVQDLLRRDAVRGPAARGAQIEEVAAQPGPRDPTAAADPDEEHHCSGDPDRQPDHPQCRRRLTSGDQQGQRRQDRAQCRRAPWSRGDTGTAARHAHP